MSGLIDNALMNDDEVAEMKVSDHNEKEIKLVVEYCEHYNWSKTETTLECPLPSKDPEVYI